MRWLQAMSSVTEIISRPGRPCKPIGQNARAFTIRAAATTTAKNRATITIAAQMTMMLVMVSLSTGHLRGIPIHYRRGFAEGFLK